MLISEVSVRWTGHLLAISSSLARCCSVSSPATVISLSIRSSMPCAVSHSAQSSAWILEWRRRTVTPLTGHPFLRAYSAIVMDVQAPRPASSRSYGPSPRSVPPADSGSSAIRRWRPAVISWANPSPGHARPRRLARLDRPCGSSGLREGLDRGEWQGAESNCRHADFQFCCVAPRDRDHPTASHTTRYHASTSAAAPRRPLCWWSAHLSDGPGDNGGTATSVEFGPGRDADATMRHPECCACWCPWNSHRTRRNQPQAQG